MGKSNNTKANGRKYAKANSWEDSPQQVKNREQRNNARRKLAKEGRVHKGDGNDVDHKVGLTGGNKGSNLRVQTKHDNRSYRRNSNHTDADFVKGKKPTKKKRTGY